MQQKTNRKTRVKLYYNCSKLIDLTVERPIITDYLLIGGFPKALLA